MDKKSGHMSFIANSKRNDRTRKMLLTKEGFLYLPNTYLPKYKKYRMKKQKNKTDN